MSGLLNGNFTYSRLGNGFDKSQETSGRMGRGTPYYNEEAEKQKNNHANVVSDSLFYTVVLAAVIYFVFVK